MGKSIRSTGLVKNTVILGIGSIGTKFISVIMLPFYTSWLSVNDYGSIDVFNALVAALVPVLSLQIEQAVFRFLIDAKEKKRKSTILKTGILTIVFILSIINILAIMLFPFIDYKLKYYFLFAIDFNVLITVLLQIIRGLGKNYAYTVNSILVCFINLLFSIIYVRYENIGVIGILRANIIANIVGIVYLLVVIWKERIWKSGSFEKTLLKTFVGYSIPMILNNVSWWILNLSDKLIVNQFLNTTYNGIYAAAGKLSYIIISLYSVFSLAWQESASRAYASVEYEEYCNKIHKIILDICIHMVAITLVISPIIFDILINEKFSQAYIHNLILIVATFFWCMSSFYGGIFVGVKNTDNLGITSMIAAITNIGINIVLINIIGLYAASISTLISYFVLFLIRYFKLQKCISIRIDMYHIFSMILAFGIGFYISIVDNKIISLIIGTLYAMAYTICSIKEIKLLLKM
ncbi:polysaccharide biosynthesis C-terminal domain-containing protein [Claveliimonas bilis]|uniref:Polysaccharide biosynthesis protein C-terminal domain-containing protein n=1 Tax=Claveliimonas bilis TaxID=3028070 RepID=A0ABM8I3T6_9FIRM|nr:polysaccharide biosynthesis C-terminal domain-containing protein [Claveliimonas bilis]BDZ76294.1 hypothetical protein Lac1_04770 [Claveliimonas bilis]